MSYGYDPNWGFRQIFTSDAMLGPEYVPTAPGLIDQAGMANLSRIGQEWLVEASTPSDAVAKAMAQGQSPSADASGATDASAESAASFIIQQENGGHAFTPNNLNCTIRPEAGCLDLNTGIFESTARSQGLDWNRLKSGDAQYGQKAVAQLLTNYANADAGNGMTVWQYGEQNLPGGGWEAVGRYYFGGCVTNGCFVDEQGRSVDTYGQQFVQKLAGAGMPLGTEQSLPASAPTVAPSTLPLDPTIAADVEYAAEVYAVPPGRLAGHVAAEGVPATNPDDSIYVSSDVYGVPAYGPLQIARTVEGTPYCTDEWCGWGDGTTETTQSGINHSIYTLDGNIMMGAKILSEAYQHAKAIAPQASDDQLWDMASSFFQTGNYSWNDGGDGQSAASYKATVDAYAAQDATAAAPAISLAAQPSPEAAGVNGPPVSLPPPDPGTVIVPPGQQTGNALVDLAQQYLGYPYVWGTHGPTSFDCSGLVSYVAAQAGYNVPTGSHAQWSSTGTPVPPGKPLQPGDLVFFDTQGGQEVQEGNTASHVGIFIGYDAAGHPQMIDALNEQEGVRIDTIDSPYWQNAYLGAKRL